MKPDFLIKGNPIGIQDKFGREICFGDIVKIHIGKPNNGYEVVYEDGAFCLRGGQLGGAMSFIKFRDELLEGRINGVPINTPYQNYLEIVDSNPQGTAGSFVSFLDLPSGGFR